jgi:DNA-binding transcriptional LysR family regulator
MSRRAVEEDQRLGILGCLRVRDFKVTRSFHVVTHRDRSRSPLAEAFRVFLDAEAVNQ